MSLNDEQIIMKPEFTAHEIDLERTDQYKISPFTKPQYKEVQISELEDVFKCLGIVDQDVPDLKSNLIILTGQPGVGKTTAAQRLAWMWAKGLGALQMYKFVFFIKIIDVDARDVSLVQVLSHLKLLPGQVTEGFHQRLSFCAKDILFIVDGADENKIAPELLNLITGKCFQESTVLVTARSWAKCFQSLSVLPRAKVTLLGYDKETVQRYMKEAVSPSSDEEWKSFEDSYKNKFYVRSLMHIPLYLTLVCEVLKPHITECLKLKVPESATEMFNTFLKVIIKRWLAKSSVLTDIRFTMSPLDSESSVPAHIKQCLYHIGKLCYTDLIAPRSQYEFTERTASEYLLDIQQIKNCGLFVLSKLDSEKIVFHVQSKQLQEYLAALYLSFEGVEEHKFNRLLYSNKAQCLVVVMHNSKLIKVVQFACGLSAKFFRSLLNVAALEFCVMKNMWNQTNIYYEAGLFTERHGGDLSGACVHNLDGFDGLKYYLFKAKQKCVELSEFDLLISHLGPDQTFGIFEKCLQQLIKLFDTQLAVDLLSRLYNIILTPVTSDGSTVYQLQGVTSGKIPPFSESPDPKNSASATSGSVFFPGSDINLSLDQLQTELMGTVCIPAVHRVNVHARDVYVDLPALVGIFPNLKELCIKVTNYKPYQSSEKPCQGISTSLTSVKLINQSAITTLPQTQVESLLKQSGLTRLLLFNVSILPALSDTHFNQSLWSHLELLKVKEECVDLQRCRALCKLLEFSCSTLKVCDLVLDGVNRQSLDTIKQWLKALHMLEDLTLAITLCDGSDVTDEVLESVLPHIKSIHSLNQVVLRADQFSLSYIKIVMKPHHKPENSQQDMELSDKFYIILKELVGPLLHIETLHSPLDVSDVNDIDAIKKVIVIIIKVMIHSYFKHVIYIFKATFQILLMINLMIN